MSEIASGRQSGRALRLGFVLDVEGYGTRTVPERDAIQYRLRRLVVAMLGESGLKLDASVVDHQWTGDGINAVLPSAVDPPAVLGMLVRSMAAGLGADNAGNADRIRLRMAIGVGLIERTAAGFGGPMIVNIGRLVDSAALRGALSDEPGADLAVALSDHVYRLIIQPGYPGIPFGQFARAKVVAKEFSGTAWIWLSTRQWSAPAYLPLAADDPRSVGGYRIVARLGAGQAGPVYLAQRPSAARAGWAALKVFDRRLAADPAVRRRLSLGAASAYVTREPHFAALIDSAVDDNEQRPWVASTLVRGPSLAAAVTETGRLPAATAGWVALGLARALAVLHSGGLTHGALAAPNVLLDSRGPVLTDLGVNRPVLVSGPATPAHDVLMLGTTVFFAVTGRSPWVAGSTDALGEPDLTGCPPALAPVVGACLAADPAARPTAGRLHAWLADEMGQQPRSWLPEPVVARVAEYATLPPTRGWARRPRGRE